MTLNPAWMNWPETQTLIKAFAEANEPIRFVGGCVRDALLGRDVKDVDVATPLTPDNVMRLLEKAGVQAVPTGLAHGTVTAVINKKHFEITTLRKDISTDGRHAEIAYTDDWKADAERRDFTMNALYLSPAGELTDYFGGEVDARAGHMKFIGKAEERIQEDYLRILRFFRFHAWYGKGEPDKEALAACAEHAKGIAKLSGERIQQEMLKLLSAPGSAQVLTEMPPEVLRQTFGFPIHHVNLVGALEMIEEALSVKPDPRVKLALLLPSVASLEHIAGKWKLSRDMQDFLKGLLMHMPHITSDMDIASQKKMLRQIGSALFKPLVVIRWTQEPEAAEAWRKIYRLADEWQVPQFEVRGKDLQSLGIPEGKAMGDVLKQLEAEWEASDYALSKDELLSRAKK